MKAKKTYLWEILLPTVRNNGKPIRARFHRVWDDKVKIITNGLTILNPVKGIWLSPNNEEFKERMIPVRILATRKQIEEVADMTAEYYEQLAVMFYKMSDEVEIKHYK